MKLQHLVIENFRSFYGEQFINFSTDDEKNKTLRSVRRAVAPLVKGQIGLVREADNKLLTDIRAEAKLARDNV